MLSIQVQMLQGVHQFLNFIYVKLGSIKMIYAWDFKSILLIIYPYIIMKTHYLRIAQLNLRDRDNFRTKNKRPVPMQSVLCSEVRL